MLTPIMKEGMAAVTYMTIMTKHPGVILREELLPIYMEVLQNALQAFLEHWLKAFLMRLKWASVWLKMQVNACLIMAVGAVLAETLMPTASMVNATGNQLVITSK